MKLQCDSRGIISRRTKWAREFAIIPLLVMMVLFGMAMDVQAENELHIYNDLSFTSNDVSGSGDDQSSISEGGHFLEVLTANGRGDLGAYKYRFNIGAKTTDDRRNDIQRYSLTHLQGRLSNRIHTLTAGDTFEAFSQYSLNTAVKGVSYSYQNQSNKLPDVTLVYGMAYPRWDNLWGLDAIERDVFGARVKQQLNDKFWVAANYVTTDDSDRVAGSSLFDTETFSVDWEYLPIPGLTIRGESAFSDTTESFTGDVDDQDQDGYAHHLEAIGDGGPSRVVLEYERISPDFLTLVGSATPDREKAKATWRYKYTKTLTMNFGFLWYRDNLNGDLDFRTDHYRPEIGVSVKRAFKRRYSVVDLTYKYDRAYGGGTSTKNHFINMGYRDRFGVFDSDTNLGMTIYDTNDRQDQDEFIYNTNLSTRYTAGMFVLKPSLRLGGWTLDNDLENTKDKIWEYSLGLGVDIPTWKVTSNLRVGQNKLQKDDGDDNKKSVANLSIYYRPECLSMFDYSRLYLRAFVNDFDYSAGNRDFRENSITIGIITRL